MGWSLEIIVDNSDAGNIMVGSWDTVTSAVSTCWGSNKYTHVPGTGTDTFTWNVSLPAGWYRVDFRMNTNTTYARDAHYTIVHRDGVDNIVIDQQRASSTWYILGGAWYFDGTASITLSDNFTQGDIVVADALRFWSVFSFVQMSDSHFGYGEGNNDGARVAGELKTLGKMTLGTYGFDAPPPSFGIHCGDFTEYGQEYWNTCMTTFSGLPFPVYYVQGNHDATWSTCKERIKTLQGSNPYTLDHYDHGRRHHFVFLNSPVLQSPRAAFAREELEWLKTDLASVDSDSIVYSVIHHPINGASDPRPYDTWRYLETLRPYNVIATFYGHGHSFNTTTLDAMRIVQGGSTYSNTIEGGYNIVTVTHGRMYVVKKIYNDPVTTNILNRTIPSASTYPVITVSAPEANAVVTNPTLSISTSISGLSTTVSAVDFELDGDDSWRAMTGSGYGPWTADLSLVSAVHGRHWIRVRFTMSSGGPWYKTVPFWFWDNKPQPRWIVDMGAASQSCPAIADGKVFLGTNGGAFRCYKTYDGSLEWKVDLPGDVVSSPEVADGKVVFGCGDSKVYCLNAADGSTVWTKTCAGPVYGSPTVDNGVVYIGTIGMGTSGSRYLYSLNLSDGSENWKHSVDNAIETKPVVSGNAVFFGAWDSYFYAVNKTTGTRLWRYQRNASRYYSPADSWPVVSESTNRVFVADREYVMNAINIGTGTADWVRGSVSSQAITPEGDALLMRLSDGTGNLDKTTFANVSLWKRGCSLDSAPVSPICNGTRTVVVDQDGLVSVVTTATGVIQYQFQVSQSYQLHPVAIDADGNVYATTYEGWLLCIDHPEYTEVADWTIY